MQENMQASTKYYIVPEIHSLTTGKEMAARLIAEHRLQGKTVAFGCEAHIVNIDNETYRAKGLPCKPQHQCPALQAQLKDLQKGKYIKERKLGLQCSLGWNPCFFPRCSETL